MFILSCLEKIGIIVRQSCECLLDFCTIDCNEDELFAINSSEYRSNLFRQTDITYFVGDFSGLESVQGNTEVIFTGSESNLHQQY